MTLRKLPGIKAKKLPDVCSFEYSDEAFQKWDSGIAARAAGSDNVISILDVIGNDPWSDSGVTSRYIAQELARIGENDVVVNLNSPGDRKSVV